MCYPSGAWLRLPWVSPLRGEGLTHSLQLPHLWTQCGMHAEATLFPGCFQPMTEYRGGGRGWLEPGLLFPMWNSLVGSCCSRSSHQRGFLWTALQFEVLSTQSSFHFCFFSRMSDLHHNLKDLLSYCCSISPSLKHKQALPTANLSYC